MSPALSHLVARIRPLLASIYPQPLADWLEERIVALAGQRLASPSPTDSAFDQTTSVLITYADTLTASQHKPLASLREFLVHRLRGAFSHVHLLPFFPASSDGGFAVIDFRSVAAHLGCWSDIESLAQEFRLGFDLVLNHASSQSPWFERFLDGQAPERDYFFCPEEGFDVTRVVRPRESALLTQFGSRRVWTTFSPDQVDLNYGSPELLLEMLGIIALYLGKGARMLRLDAVAFLWKESGTSCLHRPQTHALVKLIRAFVEAIDPTCLLLTETNVPHSENVSYFGQGDEAHLVYQFSLPPLLLHAIDTGRTEYLADWLRELKAPPEGCTFLNFTASHDGIGLRPFEGLVPRLWIDRLLQRMQSRGALLSYRRGVDGKRAPYELNTTYFDACRGFGDDPPTHEERFLLSQAVALTLQGIPAVYVHSLFATGNAFDEVERTGQARAINRSSWQLADLARCLDDPSSRHRRVFDAYTALLHRRARIEAFHPSVPQEPFELEGRVLAIRRAPENPRTPDLLALFNLSGTSAWLPLRHLPTPRGRRWSIELDRGAYFTDDRRICLKPHAFCWLTPEN